MNKKIKLLLVVAAFSIPILWFSWEKIGSYQIKNGALSWAGFSCYPKSAINFRVATAGGMFTREFIVSFEADAEDIEKWIHNSSFTKGITPEIFTKNHQYRPYPDKMSDEELFSLINDGHKYHFRLKHHPEWLNKLKINNGKKYLIHGPHGSKHHEVGGELIIDNDTNTVYLRMSWS